MSRVLENKQNKITQEYGNGHSGIDIVGAGRTLDNIVAHSDGKVVFCQTGYKNNKGSKGNASYGNCVKIKHTNGYYTLYAHMNSVSVKLNQSVCKGQKIGVMGNTGNSYGSHLHFEVFDTSNKRINPKPYIDADLPGTTTSTIAGTTTTITYKVVRGDTLEKIAKKYNTTVDSLVALNNIKDKDKIYAGQVLKIDKKSNTIYTVVAGDTLSKIAKKYNTTVDNLVALNGIVDKDKIYMGQKLKIG